MRFVFLLALAILSLSACETPVARVPVSPVSTLAAETRHETGDILEKYVAARQRLAVVGMPLLIVNAKLCPRRTLTPGFVAYSDFDLPDPLRDVAPERLKLGRDAVVLAVFPHTDAWDQGLRSGDVIVTMDGKPVRNAGNLRARLKKIKKPQSVTFGTMRNGVARTYTLPFVPVCNYPFIYMPAEREINAATDGKYIYVTQGMMDFTNDRELEAVLAHELAHDVMHHIAKEEVDIGAVRMAAIVLDTFFGLSLEEKLMDAYTAAWSPAFEKEADYVGLYLLARAGGDISAAAPLWRRIAAEHGMDAVVHPLGLVATHPASPERFAALRATESEITEKSRTGKPLMPELDKPWNFGQRFSWWSDTSEDDDEPEDSDLNH